MERSTLYISCPRFKTATLQSDNGNKIIVHTDCVLEDMFNCFEAGVLFETRPAWGTSKLLVLCERREFEEVELWSLLFFPIHTTIWGIQLLSLTWLQVEFFFLDYWIICWSGWKLAHQFSFSLFELLNNCRNIQVVRD